MLCRAVYGFILTIIIHFLYRAVNGQITYSCTCLLRTYALFSFSRECMPEKMNRTDNQSNNGVVVRVAAQEDDDDDDDYKEKGVGKNALGNKIGTLYFLKESRNS